MKRHAGAVRTTLTLEPDVALQVGREMRRTGKGFKAVVNQALRRGLGGNGTEAKPVRFKVRSHSFGLRPGIDPDRLNQLVDELEVQETARKLGL